MASEKRWKQVALFVVILLAIGILIIVLAGSGSMEVILRSILILLGAVGMVGIILGLNGFRLAEKIRCCTSHTTGTLIGIPSMKAVADIRSPAGYLFSYTVGSQEYRSISLDVKGIDAANPVGTVADIWYNPESPEVFFVSNDPSLQQDLKISRITLAVSSVLFVAGLVALLTL